MEARLAPRIARQHGAFTRAQAIAEGATYGVIQRRVGSGRWIELHPGVYTLAGMPPSWLREIRAALLAWRAPSVASNAAGAALWELPGFAPGPIEITVPPGRKGPEGPTVHRVPLPPKDVTRARGIPVTSATRTLIDLAAVASRDVVEEALDDALRRRLTSLSAMRRRIEELSTRGRPGIGRIRALVAERVGSPARSQSVLETRMLRALRAARLPRPEQQHQVGLGSGRRAFLDFAYPAARVGVETEGFRHHSGRRSWEHDRARFNSLTALGWRILHVTSTDLEEARLPATIARIRTLLDG